MIMIVGVWLLIDSGGSFDRSIGARAQVGATFCHDQCGEL